jgi:hypothetical protein
MNQETGIGNFGQLFENAGIVAATIAIIIRLVFDNALHRIVIQFEGWIFRMVR